MHPVSGSIKLMLMCMCMCLPIFMCVCVCVCVHFRCSFQVNLLLQGSINTTLYRERPVTMHSVSRSIN